MPLYNPAASGVSLDTTAAHFLPNGAASAGVQTVAAASDHVHPEEAVQSLLMGPTGCLAEAFSRPVGTSSIALSNSIPIASLIALPKGITVTNLTFVTTGSESGASHGWYALCNSSGTVLAVTADQTGNSWSSIGAITIALTSPYTTTAAGAYYAVMCVTASARPNVYGGQIINANVAGIAPYIAGTAGTQAAPPSVSSTLTIASATSGPYCYAT